jgi:cytochrome c
MRRIVVGFILVVALVAGASARAQDNDRAEGLALYKENCGMCHGEIASEASHGFDMPAVLSVVRAGLPSGPGRSDVAKRMAPGTVPSLASERFDTQRTVDDEPIAVVPPFGPPLRGVVGRLAGSVEGFPYSRAFKSTLQEVVWNREALERWITDSQAWVPGSMMFYKQPDPEIRRKIITYLETNP